MSLKRFVKDTAIYGVATVLPRIINFLLLALFTSSLNTGQFSDASVFWIYAAFFNILLTYGMETSFFRLYTKLDKDPKVLNTAFTSILVTSLIALAVLLVFKVQIAHLLKDDVVHFSFLLWIIIFDTIMVIPYAYLRVTNRPVRFAFYRISNVLINLIIILFLFLLLPYLENKLIVRTDVILKYFNNSSKVIYIFIANLVASATTLLMFAPIISKFKLSIDKKLLTKMLKYGLPIMIAGFAYVINENIDKIMIRNMLGKDIMGAYSAVYKIGTIMALFITAFRLGAEPFFFSQSKENDAKQKYAKILLWFTIVGTVFYVVIVANMDTIASIFIRQKAYYSAISIVPVILIANLMLGIYFNLAIWYKLTDRTKFGMYFSIIGSIITLVLNFVFIPKIGFMASAWATVAAYSTMAVLSYLIGRKYYPINYNIKKIVFYLILSMILSYTIFTYYYDSFFVKNTILIAYVLLIFTLERKTFYSVSKKVEI